MQSMYSFSIFSVPVVQRTEQGFPKGKTPLLQRSSAVITSAQTAVFKPIELLLLSSRVIRNLHIFTHPGDTKGDTNFSTISFAWPLVTSRAQSGLMRTMGNRSSTPKSHFADAVYFGASD
jgi:hypothetical protein